MSRLHYLRYLIVYIDHERLVVIREWLHEDILPIFKMRNQGWKTFDAAQLFYGEERDGLCHNLWWRCDLNGGNWSLGRGVSRGHQQISKRDTISSLGNDGSDAIGRFSYDLNGHGSKNGKLLLHVSR